MKIAFLPAVCTDFTPKDGKGKTVHVYRPYAAIPMHELEQHAAEDNDRGALQELGERYYFGLGTAQDYEKAYEYLLRAAEQDVQDAQFLIAECYRDGHFVQQDYEKYFEWLNLAAQNGSWMAMLNLCAAYREGPKAYGGIGPKIDHTQSFAWSQQAEQTLLGYWAFYTQPNFVDFNETKKQLLQAYATVSNQLAQHYAMGMGVNRDLDTAMSWLQRGKRFVSNATGQLRVPFFDDAIKRLKARMDKEKSGRAKK
ncbi:MAG: sel1 repeat family protein [Oscillospiraceae bacterium]|nr:sel1 repeat family protein [Oscillospiraceae bacterium]